MFFPNYELSVYRVKFINIGTNTDNNQLRIIYEYARFMSFLKEIIPIKLALSRKRRKELLVMLVLE